MAGQGTQAGTPAEVAAAAGRGREGSKPKDALVAGVASGLLAGAVMLAWAAASAALADLPASQPLALAAATFEEDAAEPRATHLLLGAALWAAVSVALALVYAAIVPRDFPFVSAAAIGVGYSFFVMALMASVVLPAVNPTMRAAMPRMGGAWVLAYTLFGLALGWIPLVRRRLSGR